MSMIENRGFSANASTKRDARTLLVGVLLAAMCVCLSSGIRSARAADAAKTTLDGVYTDDEAKRGKDQYDANCSSCHMEDLSGSGQALPLAGDAFMDVWEGQTVADLFGLIQGTMPQDKPGSLDPAVALDVISYILQQNKFPAGKAELKNDPDALKAIIITNKAPAKSH